MLALVDSAEQLLRVVGPNHLSTRIYENSGCASFSSPLGIVILFDFSHSRGYFSSCFKENAYEFHLIITTNTTIS